MNPDGAISTLRLLTNIIHNAVDTIEDTYLRSKLDFPSLDEPFDPAAPGEALRQDPAVSMAALDLIAAASQIAATVSNPTTAIVNASQGYYISACMRAASELNVVELLREAGPQGLHVKAIAAPSHVDPALLARILRLLATHNIFREVSPNVFANNRLSSPLDKDKPSSVLFKNREDRLDGSSGVAALVEFFTEDCFLSSSYLVDTMLNPKEGEIPYNRAFGTPVPMYYWIQEPENAYRRKRFGLGMQGTAAAEADTIFQGFDWGALPAGSVVVDVGAGIGSASMMIAKKHPELHIVLQDLAPTANGARVHWTQNFPEHNMVEFQGHDFFNPQPVKNAQVFLLRYIVHNWPDAQAIDILAKLRNVALPDTQLVLIEKILPVASVDQGSGAKDIPGAARLLAQAPLLSNWGCAAAELYLFDLGMHMMLGGTERTLDGYIDVVSKSGWEIVQVHHCGRSQLSHLVAKPA
ncbi:O-methyltransferase [Mycena filopes]|nr:O-methyltransferase [Mycena filopes]